MNIKKNNLEDIQKSANLFKRRIAKSDSSYYSIESIEIGENIVKCIKLYDNNGMKINYDYYFKKNYFFRLPLKDFSNSNDSNNNNIQKKYTILNSKESNNIFENYKLNNKDNTVKVIYRIIESEITNQDGFVLSKIQGRNVQIEKILPDHLKLDDYVIDSNDGMIVDVKNKADNVKVMFISEEYIDPIAKEPASLIVYYSYFKKAINVLHVHDITVNNNSLNSLNSLRLNVINLEKNENTDKVIIEDNTLNIFFKNLKIHKVISSIQKDIKELKADEVKIRSERIMKINNLNFKDYYVKIKQVPNYSISKGLNTDNSNINNNYNFNNFNNNNDIGNSDDLNYEIFGNCHFNNETLNNTAGLINVTLVFDVYEAYLDSGLNIKIPVCELEPIPVAKEMELEKILLNENKKQKQPEIIALNEMYIFAKNELEKYANNKDLISKAEVMQDLKNVIDKYNTMLPNIVKYMESNELWNLLEVNIFN